MVLGFLVAVVTFPGTIVHEYAHKKMCDWTGVDVYEVVYLRLGNPMGYVKHGEVDSFRQSFGITVAPFLINSFIAVLFFSLSALYAVFTGVYETTGDPSLVITLPFLGLIWLGFSVGMHAFPSSQDARNLWRFSRSSKGIMVKAGLPISGFIYLADKLRFFWIDALYALFLLAITGNLIMVQIFGVL